MKMSEKLKIARAAKRMSQRELAERCGLSLRTIQGYEMGSHLPKTAEIYGKLCEALEIEPEVLAEDKEELTLQNRNRTEDYERGYRAGRKSLQPKWVRAEERPPEKDGIYFAVIEEEDGSRTVSLFEMYACGSWLVDRKKRKVRYWAEQCRYDLPEEPARKGIA